MFQISVLISVYNGETASNFDLALKSIFDLQTIKPDQVVIVVDGPVNNEIEDVIKKFTKNKEEVVEVVRLNENSGLGIALKEGTKYCKGEYIVRMDSDDFSVSDRIQKLQQFLYKNPDIDVVGSIISEFKESPDEEKQSLRVCPLETKSIIKMGRKRCPMNHVSTCIKKESLIAVGGYLSFPFHEDYYLWLRMLFNGYTFANIPEVLVKVRTGSGFLQRRSKKAKIQNWNKLQKYMLKNNYISHFRYIFNVVTMYVFCICPNFVKKAIYKLVLRK